MSVSSAFLWRFLDDVWDLLPTEDRGLFQAYWSGLIQIASDLEQKTIEAALSNEIATIPVFLTERWNRFVMDEANTDTFETSDTLVLIGTTLAKLSRESGFYDTFRLSLSSGQIPHTETIQFFDQSVRSLRYGKITPGTISVKAGELEFTQNRDYVVNLGNGSIQALEGGRIPIDELLTVRYFHEEYTRGLDYEIDELKAGIFRLTSTAIANGETVVASYSYNGTATLPLEGDRASISGSNLTDQSKDFSTLLPNRTLTIRSGPNEGTYSVSAVLTPTTIQVAEGFPANQETDVDYSINAFPYGLKIDKQIVGVPVLQNRVDFPTSVMLDGVDFVLRNGILSSRNAFRISTLGSEDTRSRHMWAEVTNVDKETPYRNFGVLIDFYRPNSEEYKLALQGLWYTFWTGSTPGNLERGLHILLGLPFARNAGRVSRVDTEVGEIDITDPRGQIITYSIPADLEPEVERGDEVARFAQLTTGVQIIDRNNDPGFVTTRLGRAGIARFLTDNATQGVGDTDETKALTLLENHLFLPQVLAEAVSQRINVAELVTFLDNMKPNWTEYIFSFAVEEDEGLTLGEIFASVAPIIDLSTTVNSNEWNQAFSNQSFVIESASGNVISAGSQATGNFRDLSEDFIAKGVKPNDIVQLLDQTFKGYHRVIKVFSSTLLSLDIPDADLLEEFSVPYVLLSRELATLNHDAVHFNREHIILNGTDYPSPSGLNTKTDIAFASTTLTNDEVKALLLVDIGIVGAEVQEITDSDVENQEFSVGSPPAAPVTRDHQVASAALVRTDNTGPTVTDAFAI